MECGLKSCVVAYARRNIDVIFRERRFSERWWTHDFDELLKLAQLMARRDADVVVNPDLKLNWQVVKDWSETARYERNARVDAEGLYQAVTDPVSGVLPWIRNHWSEKRSTRRGSSSTN